MFLCEEEIATFNNKTGFIYRDITDWKKNPSVLKHGVRDLTLWGVFRKFTLAVGYINISVNFYLRNLRIYCTLGLN